MTIREIKFPAKVMRRAKRIRVLLMDVDGTITDGGVTLLSLPDGSAQEIKTFNAHDGQGLTLAHTAGIRTGVITGRGSAALHRRAKELSIEFVYGGLFRRRFAGHHHHAARGLGGGRGRCGAGSQARGASRHESHWRKRRGARSGGIDPEKQRDLGRDDRQGARLAGEVLRDKSPALLLPKEA